MGDDDDVPDDLWNLIDIIDRTHQKQTVSQAPNLFQQQQQAPPPATGSANAGGSTTSWRPNLVQQLPLAAPPKPKSLAQQLLGDSSSSLPRHINSNQAPGTTTGTYGSTQQRWTPPPQVQHPWGGSAASTSTPYQQRQQQPPAPAAGVGSSAAGGSAGRPSAGAILAAGIGLPPLTNGHSAAAPVAADVGAPAAAPTNVQATQQPQPQQAYSTDELQRLQQELQQQVQAAQQLRRQLTHAEQEKHQLQQDKQQLQQRLHSTTQPSMAQHRAQDLQRQLNTYQERLIFAEQEAQQAQAAAKDKADRAAQAEAQLKQLQDDARRKEDVLRQLQVELEQEKQRTERLAAAAAAGGGSGGQAAGASSSSLQPHLAGFTSPAPHPAAAAAAVGSSGRKRKGGGMGSAAAASTPGLPASAKAAAAAAAGMSHKTPQQQIRQKQMSQLLGSGPASVSFDIDMYDVDGDTQTHQQQEQQQQEALVEQQPEREPAPPAAAVTEAPAAAAAATAATEARSAEALPKQQPAQQQQQQQQQQPEGARSGQAAAAGGSNTTQQPTLSSSVMGKLLPALQGVQITGPKLPQLLWTTCQPAMQQLLQPLSSQLLGLSSMLASASAAAAHSNSSSRSINASNTAQLVPAALSAAQEQLSLLSAGVVTGGSALLSSLLQLVDVLVPEGPTGVCRDAGSGCSADVTMATAAAAMQAAFPVSDQQHSSQPRWLLLPQPQLQRGADGAVGRSGDQGVQELSSLLPTQQQQQLGRFLVFRSALDAGHVHILPLDLAVAVLQLLEHLACYDSSCLHMLAAQLSSSCAEQPSSSSSLQRQHSIRPVALARSSSAVPDALQAGPSSSNCSSSSRVKFKWAGDTSQVAEPALQLQLQDRSRRSSGQTAVGSLLAATQTHFNTLRLQEASAVGVCSSSSGGPTWQQQQQHRSLPVLLSDAARCHSSLLQHVGSLLAAVAAELPVSLQPSLLQGVVVPEQGLLLLLLQAESWTSRCIAAALLQQLLTSTEVAAVLAAAIKGTGPEITSADQQQQQNDDVIMIDVSEQPAPSTALQPLNHRAAGGSKAAAAAAAAGSNRPGKTLQQQQQRQPAAGSSIQPQPHPQQQQQHLFVLAAPVVQELVLQLLDGFSFGLEEAFQTLQGQGPVLQQQQTLPPSTHSSSNRGQGLGSSSNSTSRLCAGSSNAAGSGGSRASVLWGVFELQRRCCAVMAHLLHSRQDVLLLYSLDLQATAGYGLAQRLLVMVDAACSPAGGDPFAALTPEAPVFSATAAAAAAPSGGQGTGSTVCGSRCSWAGCLEHLRLAHEGLLLLRALVATPGAVGTAAMADLSSNSTSLRLIMTTRAKLAEVTTALTAAAAAGSGTCAPGAGQPAATSGSSSSSSTSAAASPALPLSPWAWPWSAQCGCRVVSSNKTDSSSGLGVGQQALHAQQPPLQSVLQEMGNTAASIHRRVMIYLRSQEAAMQS